MYTILFIFAFLVAVVLFSPWWFSMRMSALVGASAFALPILFPLLKADAEIIRILLLCLFAPCAVGLVFKPILWRSGPSLLSVRADAIIMTSLAFFAALFAFVQLSRKLAGQDLLYLPEFGIGLTGVAIMAASRLTSGRSIIVSALSFGASLIILSAWSALVYPQIVLSKVSAHARGTNHCILLVSRNRTAQRASDLTFLSMDKSTRPHQAHVVLTIAQSELPRYWSYHARDFLDFPFPEFAGPSCDASARASNLLPPRPRILITQPTGSEAP